MQTKFFEIRDNATLIPALAILIEYNDSWLARKVGFEGSSIILMKLNDQKAHSDPYDWKDRTMQTAHIIIEENFEFLKNGAVIDVRVYLGERTTPVESERSLHE